MKQTILIIIISLLSCFQLIAQENRKIMISVNDRTQPLPGASIVYKSETKDSLIHLVVQTDFNGKGIIQLAKSESEIDVSYVCPLFKVPVIQKCDSVSIQLFKRKASYFINGKRVEKKKF